MDYSDSLAENNTKGHHHGVLRALISATVFGTLGALVGRWLGKHGNDPTSKMAEPLMKWGMGVFCGLLGAYSSLKVSQHHDNGPESAEVVTKTSLPEKQSSALEKTKISTVKHDGKLEKTSVHVALEK